MNDQRILTHLLMVFVLLYLVFVPKAHAQSESMCLAEAMFYEAEAETTTGKLWVGHTVLNRIDSCLFPSYKPCDVIKEKGQFQWKKNVSLRKGRRFNPTNHAVYVMLAENLWESQLFGYRKDITGGAIYFAGRGYNPSKNARFIKQVGNHNFYKQRPGTARCIKA